MGCTDVIVCARQLMEKVREHNKFYMYCLLVDLSKAYESVPTLSNLTCMILAKAFPLHQQD